MRYDPLSTLSADEQYHKFHDACPPYYNYKSSQLTLETFLHQPDHILQNATSALPTPSPSDISFLWNQSQTPAYATSHAPFKTSLPSVVSQQTELARYQDEMEETLLGVERVDQTKVCQGMALNTFPNSWSMNHEEYNKKAAYSMSGSSRSLANSPVGVELCMSDLHNHQNPTWPLISTHHESADAIPISQSAGIIQNHLLGSDGLSWSSEDTGSMTSRLSTAITGSFSGHTYESGQSRFSYRHLNQTTERSTAHWVADGSTSLKDIDEVHLRSQGGDNHNSLSNLQTEQIHTIDQSLALPHSPFGSSHVGDRPPMGYMQGTTSRHGGPPVMTMSCPMNSVDRDRILLECRAHGMSYKDIKRKYDFAEAESTLRGRHRTLTKDKKQRVRKPEWTPLDCRLLKEAVAHFVGSDRKMKQTRTEDDVSRLNIPWKEVCAYIVAHGGTYEFGYATAKKKFIALLEQDRDSATHASFR
ncbi:uncharacterized protein PV09_06079 [Verruconis gallopava]|uniref:Myb-like domain-containing protein n=1 Tax=Verruconis gallopava TaxID=253628 RepID=A0A0D2AU34_9PEZI|nr:uncharacterized protein PV09_06079 [Verruconis gallopava]KIW02639.1 hypothetical protein PV09_06079 [Verruconis gallopava]